MPVPTGVTVTINTGDEATNDLDVSLAIAADGATGVTHSMRLSNNGGNDWSPVEAFATSKAWNLSDFGGGAQEGIRTVLLEVIDNGDSAFAQDSDNIRFEVPVPRVVFDSSNPPLQRADTNLIDIPFKGFEDSLAAADLVNILEAEIDSTGLFTGGEVPLYFVQDDPLHDGIVGLPFSNAGEDLNLVADLLKSFGGETFSSTTKIRLKPQFGAKVGEFGESNTIPVSVFDPPITEIQGRKTIPGRQITLIAYFRNALNELENPISTPSVTQILDSTGTDRLGTPTDMTQISVGIWKLDFTPGTGDPVGQWVYDVDYEMLGPAGVQTFRGLFEVADPTTVSFPLYDNTCVVFGDLVRGDGSPFQDVEIRITPHHLSDPELGNTTTIGTRPVIVRTDANGHFEVEMVRNTEVVLGINDLSYAQFGKVPDLDAAEYRSMQVDLPVGTRDKFGNRLP
jgi:hypothetical protein